jgi:hypothetical protein
VRQLSGRANMQTILHRFQMASISGTRVANVFVIKTIVDIRFQK